MISTLLSVGLTLAAAPWQIASRTHGTLDQPCTAERVRDELSVALSAFQRTAGVPGVSLGLVLPDGTQLGLVAGDASREDQEPMGPNMRLLLGSVGKTYVSAAALHLVHAGKLDLDLPVACYLGDREWFARMPNAEELTVRRLLLHRSGIPRYVMKGEFWAALIEAPDRTWLPAELLAFVFDERPLFPAGAEFAYSDTNYILVGLVLEHVSGIPFYSYVQEHLLEPHDIADTIPTNSREIPGMAQAYIVVARQFGLGERSLEEGVFTYNPQFEWCGGGWATTPVALARWARILYSGQAFDAPYLDEMLDGRDAPQLGPGTGYGLGVFLEDSDAGPCMGHDGFMPGYLTSMRYFPESDLALALQVNTDDSRAFGALKFELVRLAQVALAALSGADARAPAAR